MEVYIKNLIMHVVLYFMIYCAKFKVSNLNLIFHHPLRWRFGGTEWELSKNYLTAFCPHIDYISLQNLEPLALMVSEIHCLDMTDRPMDMAKSSH